MSLNAFRLAVMICLINAGTSAADQFIEKDGKKVLLKDDGTWEYAEEVITGDGRKIILKNDGTWEYADRKDKVKAEVKPAAGGYSKTGGLEEGFWVYNDNDSPENRFFYPGLFGDHDDIKYDGDFRANSYSGDTCVKIVYSAKAKQGMRWAGLCWQRIDYSGTGKNKGFDLSGLTKLVFYARGEKGGERIEEFKVGSIEGEHPDSGTGAAGPVVLGKEWKKYTVDLSGKDMSDINRGLLIRLSADSNPKGAIFYLDEICFE